MFGLCRDLQCTTHRVLYHDLKLHLYKNPSCYKVLIIYPEKPFQQATDSSYNQNLPGIIHILRYVLGFHDCSHNRRK